MQIFKTVLNSWHPKYMQNFKTKLEVKISISSIEWKEQT